MSITAGRVYLVDISFDKPISPEMLTALPGVNRLETAQAIEAAERLRAQQAMAVPGRPGGMGGPGRMPAQPAAVTTSQGLPGSGAGKAQGSDTGERNKTDNRFRIYTDNTTLLTCSLVDLSRAHSLKMNILNIRPPSLEDAFVRLTEEKSHGK